VHAGESAPRPGLIADMGRHRLTIERWNRQIEPGDDPDERWEFFYRTPYTEMIGSRLRRLRDARGLSQNRLRYGVRRPRGGPYSQSVISRLERGYANAPVYVYLHIAEAFDLAPEVLLGPDDALKPVSEAEMTLLRTLRRLSVSPDEALARVAASPGSSAGPERPA
jgi:transcriptional regulator with XRE-family HTH domain